MAHGAVRLGELLDGGQEQVVITCKPCKRKGRYSVRRLVEDHGRDVAMPDVLKHLTRTCERPQDPGHHRCHAIYERDW